MKKIDVEALLKELIGSRIVNISRACNLVMFAFLTKQKKDINIHAQCLLRLFDKNDLILTSESLYYPGKKYKKKLFKKFDWTMPESNVFDDIIDNYRNDISLGVVKEIIRDNKDIKIILDNGFKLEILELVNKIEESDYKENYRIFETDQEHYVM